MAGAQTSGGGDLGFEAELFKAADKLRGNLEPSEYKHVALGLIFLKYISEAFEAQHTKLQGEEFADPEDPEEYLAANVFWVPAEARWAHLQANAKRREIEFVDVTTGQTKKGDIGGLIDNAMEAIEKANITVLKDVLPKIFAQPKLDKTMVGELIDLFSNIDLGGGDPGKARDLLGRAYEYFISQFAGAEGKRGGEFFTPPSVVRTLVEMLEPYRGRVYDPCCGSGGMFVQSEKFIEDHADKRHVEEAKRQISIYGQERNHFSAAPSHLARLRLPAQRYAVFRHAGHVSTLGKAYEAILNDWLPDAGLTLADGPSLEWHARSFDPMTGEGGLEIWLPVVR